MALWPKNIISNLKKNISAIVDPAPIVKSQNTDIPERTFILAINVSFNALVGDCKPSSKLIRNTKFVLISVAVMIQKEKKLMELRQQLKLDKEICCFFGF